jgi:hypothetical protein
MNFKEIERRSLGWIDLAQYRNKRLTVVEQRRTFGLLNTGGISWVAKQLVAS